MGTEITPQFSTSVLIEINKPDEVVAENRIPYYVEKFDFFKTYSEDPPEGYELFVFFDEHEDIYKKRYFRKSDIEKVREAAVTLLDKIVSDAEKSTAEPNWSHAYFIKEHIFGYYADADTQKKWDAFVAFFIHLYSGGRYKWRQQIVLKDILHDFECENNPHIQLLVRHIAAQIGYALGNVAGD